VTPNAHANAALLPSSSPSLAFDVALIVGWIIHARGRHPLHVAVIVGTLVAWIHGRVDWPSVGAMFGFPFLLGLAILHVDSKTCWPRTPASQCFSCANLAMSELLANYRIL
jgi:hypothetical protein